MVGSLAMVMDPAPFVIVIPLPAVNVDTTGAALVEPISNCPFVIAPASTIEPPDETMMRLLFNVVDEFVPPFAMGNTPDTCVVNPIFPHDGAVDVPPDINAFPVA